MYRRGIVLILCLFISSSFANTQQYTKEQIEDIIFDFRVGVDSKIKEERLEQLLTIGKPVIPILIECLKDKLPEPLETKVQEQIRNEVDSYYFERSDSSSVPIQGWIETTLKRIGKPAVQELIESINKQPETASQAVRILGNIGDKRAVPSIINVLDNTNIFYTKCYAANALGKLNSIQAIPYLIEALKGQPDDPYNSYRLSNQAADSLAKITGQSFGFTLTFIRTSKGGDKSASFELNGNETKKAETIKQWTEWWHNYEIQLSEISNILNAYAESLSKSNTQAIESLRSSDYIQLINGTIIDQSIHNNKENILSNCTKYLIDSLEYRKIVEYQIKCESIKSKRNNIIVTCEDKLLLESDEYKRIFTSNTKRILVKNGESYKIVQEDLSTWTDRTYDLETIN